MKFYNTETTVFTAPYLFVFVKGRKFEFLHPFKTSLTRDDSSFSSIALEAPYLIPDYYTRMKNALLRPTPLKKRVF